jgi:hypothetical protein
MNHRSIIKSIASLALVVACAMPMLAWPLPQAPAYADGEAQVFRDAFTLKLRGTNGTNYKKPFDKVPYVDGGDVYLFVGDKFGVNVAVSGDEITGLTYVQNPDKADVGLEFTEQNLKGAGRSEVMMMLSINSKLKRPLFIDALMTVPMKNGIYNTDILPIPAGLGDFESWPHPIVQLVLWNSRFAQQPSGQTGRRADAPRYMSPATTH